MKILNQEIRGGSTLAAGDHRYGGGMVVGLFPFGVDGFAILDRFTDSGDAFEYAEKAFIYPWWNLCVTADSLEEGLNALDNKLITLGDKLDDVRAVISLIVELNPKVKAVSNDYDFRKLLEMVDLNEPDIAILLDKLFEIQAQYNPMKG